MPGVDVFISYRHTEAEAVSAFAAALRRVGLDVWPG